jgi:hypothetical protein
MRTIRDRLRRAERRAEARPSCPCMDPASREFRILVKEIGDGADRVFGTDPGPCPRCGAPPFRIEIAECPANGGADERGGASNR